MTKKYLIALAARIAEIKTMEGRREAASAVADVAARFNPLFDRARFMTACKLGE